MTDEFNETLSFELARNRMAYLCAFNGIYGPQDLSSEDYAARLVPSIRKVYEENLTKYGPNESENPIAKKQVSYLKKVLALQDCELAEVASRLLIPALIAEKQRDYSI